MPAAMLLMQEQPRKTQIRGTVHTEVQTLAPFSCALAFAARFCHGCAPPNQIEMGAALCAALPAGKLAPGRGRNWECCRIAASTSTFSIIAKPAGRKARLICNHSRLSHHFELLLYRLATCSLRLNMQSTMLTGLQS